MFTYTESTVLVAETCPACGVLFAMPQTLNKELRDTGATFYCPTGHSMSYGKGNNAKLRDELERAKRQLENSRTYGRAIADQKEAAERSNRALRGANTKLRKRVAAGVCPCCQRSFQNLARHMAGQHPNFAGEIANGGDGR